MKEVLVKRIAEIEQAIQQVVANHASLLGHLEEAKYLLQECFKAECETHPEIKAVIDGAVAIEKTVESELLGKSEDHPS